MLNLGEKRTDVCCSHCDKNYGEEIPKASVVIDHLAECHTKEFNPFARALNKNIRLQEFRIVSKELHDMLSDDKDSPPDD